MSDLIDGASLVELARLAEARLPANAHGYFATGARDEHTLRRNVAAWRAWELRPRVLVDVSAATIDTTFLGAACVPFGVAPMAAQRLAHPDGELATARAAAAAGCVMVVSQSTNVPVETLTAAPGLTAWFQLYLSPDRDRDARIVRRVTEAGVRALVVTADVPVDVNTHRRPRGGVSMPDWLDFPMHGGPPAVDSTMSWDRLAWLRELTDLPVLLKGVTHQDDAVRAFDAGCAGVVVSNHGGRQLDGVAPTADLLPEVVAAVGARGEIYVDGGLRRGVDVLRALALGARGALIGRPVLWGLAAGGEPGVRRVLSVLADELAVDAALAGVPNLTAVPRDLVCRRGQFP